MVQIRERLEYLAMSDVVGLFCICFVGIQQMSGVTFSSAECILGTIGLPGSA